MTKRNIPSDEVPDLIKTIGNNPDPLHSDFTPSMLRLIELGLPAALRVVDLLDAPELVTRERAQRVLEGIVMRYHGWRPGQGYPDAKGHLKTEAVLAENDYQAAAPAKSRKAGIKKWRSWIQEREE
jgi:hypothetical protein